MLSPGRTSTTCSSVPCSLLLPGGYTTSHARGSTAWNAPRHGAAASGMAWAAWTRPAAAARVVAAVVAGHARKPALLPRALGTVGLATAHARRLSASGVRHDVLSAPADGGEGVPNANLAVAGPVVTGDFTLTSLGSTTATDSPFNDFSLIFGFRDPADYWFVSFSESNDPNTSGIFRVTGGVRTELADITSPIVAGAVYPVRIERRGTALRVFRAEEQVAAVTDAASTDGRVGFGSRNDGGTFDDLVVMGPAGVLAKRRPMRGTAAGQLLEDVASRLGGGVAHTAAMIRSRPWRKPAARHVFAALLAAVATEIGLRTIRLRTLADPRGSARARRSGPRPAEPPAGTTGRWRCALSRGAMPDAGVAFRRRRQVPADVARGGLSAAQACAHRAIGHRAP